MRSCRRLIGTVVGGPGGRPGAGSVPPPACHSGAARPSGPLRFYAPSAGAQIQGAVGPRGGGRPGPGLADRRGAAAQEPECDGGRLLLTHARPVSEFAPQCPPVPGSPSPTTPTSPLRTRTIRASETPSELGLHKAASAVCNLLLVFRPRVLGLRPKTRHPHGAPGGLRRWSVRHSLRS